MEPAILKIMLLVFLAIPTLYFVNHGMASREPLKFWYLGLIAALGFGLGVVITSIIQGGWSVDNLLGGALAAICFPGVTNSRNQYYRKKRFEK